jgi:hypothetical protein
LQKRSGSSGGFIDSLAATHLIPSTSTGVTRSDCAGCNQTLINRKLEIENLKTKSKLDHLKLVMQQKKERREARKLKIAPYNINAQHVSHLNQSITSLPYSLESADNSMNESLSGMPGTSASLTSNHLNTSTDSNSSSSATATAAIATSISTNNSEIENHLEEVDTVA